MSFKLQNTRMRKTDGLWLQKYGLYYIFVFIIIYLFILNINLCVGDSVSRARQCSLRMSNSAHVQMVLFVTEDLQVFRWKLTCKHVHGHRDYEI